PAHGTLILSPDGSYTYVHNGSETTTDSFTYKAKDGALDSAPATVNLTITPVNDAPTLTRVDTLNGATEDTPFSISYATLAAAADEADVDGGALSFQIEAVSTGTLTKGGVPVTPAATRLGIGETLVWTPAADANQTLNAFTVKAHDGTTASASPVQAQVSVAAVNDAPSFVKGPDQTVLEDAGTQSVLNWATGISNGAADEATQSRSFSVTIVSATNPDLFAVAPALSAEGTLTYTTKADASGSAILDVVLKDDGGTADGGRDTSDPQRFNITVTAVNDAPVLTSDDTLPLSYTENDPPTPVSPTLRVNDADDVNLESATVRIVDNYRVGGDVLVVTGPLPTGIAAAPFDSAQGTLRFSGTASVADYQAALRLVAYQNTSDNPNVVPRTVRFLVNDGDLDSNLLEREIRITAVNDAPEVRIVSIIEAGVREIGPDDFVLAGLEIELTGTFTDVDNTTGHTAKIDWGDGQIDYLGDVSPSTPIRAFHTYTTTDPETLYTLKLTVVDPENADGDASRDLKVVNGSLALKTVAEILTDLLDEGGLSAKAEKALRDALEKLIGQNGGNANNGALDQLELGNVEAALVKTRQAIADLQAAQAADPTLDLAPLQQLLALSAESIINRAILTAEAAGNSAQDDQAIAEAEAMVNQGQLLIQGNNFLGAVDKFLEALTKIKPLLQKVGKTGLAAARVLSIRRLWGDGEAQVEIVVVGLASSEVAIDFSTDLSDWHRLKTLRLNESGQGVLRLAGPTESGFYRLHPIMQEPK
ncbi:MAG: hypothetical protein HY735_19665, partial [Verrucomicrobia bacterium]|nr:hypothetical protein [Verrucomicrobiota bacterium]